MRDGVHVQVVYMSIHMYMYVGSIDWSKAKAKVALLYLPPCSFIHWIYVDGAYFDFINSYIILLQVTHSYMYMYIVCIVYIWESTVQ